MKSLHEEYGSDAPKVLGIGMVSAAEKSPIPARFKARSIEGKAQMIVLDTETGKEATVSLCHYIGVRKALTDLFG